MTDHSLMCDSEIRLLVVDDHHMVREGLISLLRSVPQMNIVAEAPNGDVATTLFREFQPDVVLMDLRMPVMGGVAATRAICREFPAAKILVLTTFDGDEDVYQALQAGARGYLLKGMLGNELIEAIRSIHAGQRSLAPAIAQQFAHHMTTPELTRRELDVLESIVTGKSNREIAASLRISEATVKTHINSLLSKLDVSDRTQAAVTAIQRGLVQLELVADKLNFGRSLR